MPFEKNISRRRFSKSLLAAVTSYALLDSVFMTRSFGKAFQPVADHWAKDLNEMCQDLKLSRIPQQTWQEQVEQLFEQADLEELLGFIDFERLAKGFKYPDLGVHTKWVKFPPLGGLPEKTVFLKKIFGMKKGRAIIPHGHSNMVSAHLVLKGEFSLKHYQKIKDEQTHLIIRPTIDTLAKPGSSSSISDEQNNIHWFIAQSETAFTFDVIMLDLEEKPYDIHNLDIREGEPLSGNLIRARKLDVETALKKYGKESHH